jgi:hypothetical protein
MNGELPSWNDWNYSPTFAWQSKLQGSAAYKRWRIRRQRASDLSSNKDIVDLSIAAKASGRIQTGPCSQQKNTGSSGHNISPA